MIKTDRRKELEQKEVELQRLKVIIDEMKNWCAFDSPEIGFAMLYLQNRRCDISLFRERLRSGIYTFEEFKNADIKTLAKGRD